MKIVTLSFAVVALLGQPTTTVAKASSSHREAAKTPCDGLQAWTDVS